MSSPDRRAFLITLGLGGLSLGLSACGFTPALAPDGPGRAIQGDVAFDVPKGKLGFLLREVLEDRFGYPTSAASMQLKADLIMDESGLVITPDSSITRYVVNARSRWALKELGTDKVIQHGVAETMTAYSATGSLFATRAARQDAEARAAKDLGEKIWTACIAGFADRAE